jgi:hypothetical protein
MYIGSSGSPTWVAKESPDLIVLLSADSIQFPTYEVGIHTQKNVDVNQPQIYTKTGLYLQIRWCNH